MLKFLFDRLPDYDANKFINELFEVSKLLGVLDAKISNYQFSGILIPMFHRKEAISSMAIEGTQTTISDVFESELQPKKVEDKPIQEVNNHINTLMFGADYLRSNPFSSDFLFQIHRRMMDGLVSEKKKDSIGKYKTKDNFIVNSVKKVIFTPPSYIETGKYMKELIAFMNDTNDGINPIIKAAIMHSQFESIHPFEDGNGRVGRILISLYFYKAKIIKFPFFYISEAINQEKAVYYSKLTSSRTGNYDEWIKFFLQKCIVQSHNLINYIDSLNTLYEKTKSIVRSAINSPNFDRIIECLFTHPILNSTYLSKHLDVTIVQAKRYLDTLEEKHLILSNDKQRNKTYYFMDLLDLARRA